MTASLFFDATKHVVRFISEGRTKTDYVQHVGKSVDLLSMETGKFQKTFSPGESKHKPSKIAENFLGLAKTGVSVTPAARFALEQVICKAPLNEEPIMAVPTNLKSKKAEKPAKAEKPVKRLTDLETPDGPEIETPWDTTPVESKKAPKEVSQIVAEAKAAAETMIAEAKAMLEEATAKAQAKAQAKREEETAKAAAAKILAAAKKEVEKIKKAVKALSKSAGRRAASEDGEKAPRKPRAPKQDISGMKIVKLNDPTGREGSSSYERKMAVYGEKTVEGALEYEGVNPGFILKMVADGFIELK